MLHFELNQIVYQVLAQPEVRSYEQLLGLYEGCPRTSQYEHQHLDFMVLGNRLRRVVPHTLLTSDHMVCIGRCYTFQPESS
jgi:hypothetical protein